MGYKRSDFIKMCKAEGVVLSRVLAEVKERKLYPRSRLRGAYMARRMKELAGCPGTSTSIREGRISSPGVKVLPEQAGIGRVKGEEDDGRIDNGLEEAARMWGNEVGQKELPVIVQVQIHMPGLMQTSATSTSLTEGEAGRRSLFVELKAAPSGPVMESTSQARSTDLDGLLGELAVCCDRVTNAILATKEVSVFHASSNSCG
jgi:hypothetical protein